MEELNTFFAQKKRFTFLDLNVSLENGSITTDLHTKITDSDQCFHRFSLIPPL